MSSQQADRGIVTLRSSHNVPQTIEKFASILGEHGVAIFARIDFSGDAAKVGLTMRPEQMLIFGNPKGGTPLMQAQPRVGLDLPLKALVWEDEQGVTWVAYNSPDYIVERHGLPQAMGAPLAGALALLQQAVS